MSRAVTLILPLIAALSLVAGCGGGDTTTIIQNGEAPTTVPNGATDAVFFPSHCSDQAFRPVEIVLSCGDAQLRIEDLTWTSWDTQTATGHGSLTYPSCPPVVPLYRCNMRGSVPTTVTLDQPRFCANVKYKSFTRLHSLAPTATGTTGDGHPLADFTRPFGCESRESAPTTTTTATETTATATQTVASGREVSFASPTRNIVCHVTPVEATCGILQFSFDPPPDSANCGPERWGHTLKVDAEGDASFICSNEPPAEPSTAPVLHYGTFVRDGSIECGASNVGIYCESRNSHQGFGVSRERYGFG